MATSLQGTQYAVTATATQPFKTTPGHVPVQEFIFSTPANAQPVFVGKDNTVTNAPANAIMRIPASTTYSNIGPFAAGSIYADDLWIVGTANDTLHIVLVPY